MGDRAGIARVHGGTLGGPYLVCIGAALALSTAHQNRTSEGVGAVGEPECPSLLAWGWPAESQTLTDEHEAVLGGRGNEGPC